MNIINRTFYKGALLSLFVFVGACTQEASKDLSNTKIDQHYHQLLDSTFRYLDRIASSSGDANKNYLYARDFFKQAEPFLAFADANNFSYLNAPNLLKVEEEAQTDIKINEPVGFQVLEEEIYADTIDWSKVRQIAERTKQRIALVNKTTKVLDLRPYHWLWVIRDQYLRIMSLGITGFDSPMLQNSLPEARANLKSIRLIWAEKSALFQNEKLKDQIFVSLANMDQALMSDFESFDRYHFIKEHIEPSLSLWLQVAEDWKVDFPFDVALNNEAPSFYSAHTFNSRHFSSKSAYPPQEELVTLGKKLFNDPRLATSGDMSCATCHQRDLAFTDGKKIAFQGTRNTPTIMYAGLQKGFFYDNRAGSLEGQIRHVVKNTMEFNTNMDSMVAVVQRDSSYQQDFAAQNLGDISKQKVLNLLSVYIRSEAPFESKFDKNIRGEALDLSEQEILGFNLFMGKASCATCHFAPLFNGTVPARYAESEMELLGVPQNPDTVRAVIDPDPGRYEVYQTEEKRFFFKTPGLRNVALTAPYMHNGVYEMLEEVVDFYNRGGGAGIGIHQELQTLPPDPLDLTQEEQDAIVAFLKTLSDPLD